MKVIYCVWYTFNNFNRGWIQISAKMVSFWIIVTIHLCFPWIRSILSFSKCCFRIVSFLCSTINLHNCHQKYGTKNPICKTYYFIQNERSQNVCKQPVINMFFYYPHYIILNWIKNQFHRLCTHHLNYSCSCLSPTGRSPFIKFPSVMF